MNITDKLYTEWAWRSRTGTPSMDNPEDKTILDNIIKELTEESDINDIKKNLLNIINNIQDPSELTKISKYASNLGFSKGIDSYLESKNLSPKDIIFFKTLLGDLGKTGEFAKLAQNPPTFNVEGGNYYEQIPGFETNELKSLYSDMKDSIKGTVSMGPGEAFLSVFFKNIKVAGGKGDIVIDNNGVNLDVELKSRTGDTGALAAASYVVRGKAEGLKNDLVKLVEKTKLEAEDKQQIKNGVLSRGSWPVKIDYVYKSLIAKGLESRNVIKELSKEISSWYKNKLQLDSSKFFTSDEFKHSEFVVELAKQLARDYYKEHEFDAFMISDPNGNFKFYEGSKFVNAIGSDITPAYPSDLVPRIRV